MAGSQNRRNELPDWDEDGPMNEAEWEAFLKRADLRSARFGELLETLQDDPDAEAKIGREMGWNFPDEAAGDEQPDWSADLSEEELAEAHEELEESDRELEQIPAYQKAMALVERVSAVLKPLEDRTPGDDEDLDELIGRAFSNAMIPVARIAGGHAMGYDEIALGGNIVRNKEALAAATLCAEAWQELRQHGLIDVATVDSILAQVSDLQKELESRLEELRGRMWW